MAKKIKEIKFVEPMYQADIRYLIGGSADDLIRLMKRRHGDAQKYSWDRKFDWGEDANTTDGYQFHFNAIHGKGEVFYLWMQEPTAYLTMHEFIHLVGDVLFVRGIGYCYESEEVYAYLGGYLFEKFYSAYGKYLKIGE